MAKEKIVDNTEQTLVLIKPDAIAMGCAGKIRERYTDAGLVVLHESVVRLSREDVSEFYRDHAGLHYWPALLEAMTERLCRGYVLSGQDAIKEVRKLNGPTDSSKAPKGTIRGDFGGAGGPYNLVHASDSYESYIHEVNIFLNAVRNGLPHLIDLDFGEE